MSVSLLVFELGGERLALTPEMRTEARRLATAMFPDPSTTPEVDERIVDAEGAAALTGVPKTWFEEQARRGAIPHLRFGKYVRFRLTEVLGAVAQQPRSARL